jgi:hypothetical protein
MVPRQIRTLIAAAAALLAWGAGVEMPTTSAGVADCLTAPYFSAAEGSYWSYRTDRATKRKCWFLRAKNQSMQQPTEQAALEGDSATRTPASEQPANASVGAPTSIPRVDSAAPHTSAHKPDAPAPGVGATNTARADDCLTAPNSPAAKGRRWFYRTDRETQRKCWYLRAAGETTQRTAAQSPSAVAPAKKTNAFDNATASAGAPLLIPSPALKPQPAPISNATTEDLVAQSALAGNASPSSRERPAARIGAQAAGPVPAAGAASPTVAAANAAEPNVSASGVNAGSLRPTVDARARDDAESPARGGASSANATGIAISPMGTLVQMFLIVALGLGVAGFLYHVVTAAARRRQRTEHLASDGIGNQNPHKWEDNQQQYAVDEDLHRPTISGANDSEDQQHHCSVDERDHFTDDLHRLTIAAANDRSDQQYQDSVDDRDPLIDDLHRALMTGANDYDERRPCSADDEWPNRVRRTGGASQITDDISARENTLVQLRRDLDRLLQQRSSDVHGSIDERERFIDDLHRSPISGANDNGSGEGDHDAGRPSNDEWPNNARPMGGASHLTDEVSERDKRLAQLTRDLDLLLQPPARKFQGTG